MTYFKSGKLFLMKTFSLKFLVIISSLFMTFGLVAKAAAQEGDTLAIPDAYKIEGIPAIKNADVANLFFDSTLVKSNLIWEADGKNRRLLVTDQTNNIYLLDSPMTKPAKLVEKIVPKTVRMRSDGESFAYTSDYEDEDNFQLYLFDFKEKTPRKLTVPTAKDESVESFGWNVTGDTLFYTKVDYDSKTSKLCRHDLISEKCFPADLRGIWNVHEIKDNQVLLKYWKASSSQFLYLYDVQSNKLTVLDEKGNNRKAFFVGDRILWTSEGNDFCNKQPCILSVNPKNQDLKRLNLPPDILIFSDVKVSPSGNNLLVQESKNGADNLRVFRLRKDKIAGEFPQFITGSFVIWNTRWLSDKDIVYTLENNSKPTSIQSFNLDSKQSTNWTKEKLPAQLENQVKPPEIVKWKSFDDKEISGYIVRPIKTEKKLPVLIFVHGGPQILDKPVFNLQDIRLASYLGIAVIHTNIRGSSGFGNEFMDADNVEKRGDAVKDIQSLLDWVEKQPDLDAKQIYLRGESYGGFIVLSTALQEPSRIKGVIAEYPLVSIRGLLSQNWIDEFAKIEYGDPKNEDLMKKLDALSPLGNANRWNNIPLFLTRGKLDSRNPEKDVIDLKNQLQNKGAEVWFIYSTKDGHGFGGKYVTAAMFTFLKKQLQKRN